LTHILDIEH